MKIIILFRYTLLLVILISINCKVISQTGATTTYDSLAQNVNKISNEINIIKKLKISGYLQTQYQYCETAGAQSFAGGDFISGTSKLNSRFMIRRGRIKFTYQDENFLFSLQPDVNEKGITMRETYVRVYDPWLKIASITAGLLQVPFGFELTQSSSVRETPERARYNQILFPGERDLGVFLSISVPESSMFNGLKLETSIMNGAASISPEFDNNKDFNERLSYQKVNKTESFVFGLGISNYHGGYRIGSVKDFKFTSLPNGDKGYVVSSDTSNFNRKAVRNYHGVDVQISVKIPTIGLATIRAEYIEGEQPGNNQNSKSIGFAPTSSIFHRHFNGTYLYFIQDIGQSPFQAVAKYDFYDPNTEISKNEIGKAGTLTNTGDIKYSTFGFGVNYSMNHHVKLSVYYDIVKNESTALLGYQNDIADNVTTVRLQYKF